MPFVSTVSHPKPFLQVFTGEPPDTPPPPPPPLPLPRSTLRLCDVWEQHVRHDQVAPAKKTVKEYETALNHWRKLTGNVPVSEITRDLLRDVQRQLLAGKHSKKGHRSAATVNKILRTLRPLIVRCWPRDSHNPDGLGLCEYFRFPPALKYQKRIPRVLSDDEIQALFSAADAAVWRSAEQGVPIASLLRAAMVCHFNCGPRTFDLLGWSWESIDWSFSRSGCLGTVEFTAQKTGKLQRLPLNATTAAALRKIQPPAATGPIWPRCQRSNATQVRRVWQQVTLAAGVDARMEDFRKTCNTRHEANRRGMGPWVLGHGTSGVNATNYYDPTDDVLQAMASLPQPQCFRDWVA